MNAPAGLLVTTALQDRLVALVREEWPDEEAENHAFEDKIRAVAPLTYLPFDLLDDASAEDRLDDFESWSPEEAILIAADYFGVAFG